MIGTIVSKELRSLFVSPLAWFLLVLMQVVLTWVFLGRLDAYLHVQPQLQQIANPPGFTEIIVTPVFAMAALLLLMIIPLLAMRLLAEERKNRTLILLISAPVSITEIVLGKFLGVMLFIAGVMILIVMLSMTLSAGGTMDSGLLISNVLGLFLVTCCFVALGLFISSLTMQPIIAALGTLGVLLCFWVLDILDSGQGSWIHYFSLLKHFKQFNSGLLDSFSIAYLVLFTLFFIALAIRRLDGDRLHR
ncbi:MAG: ABC transporter permease [Nitrosomonas sp.]|nr:ABC transporter permease [Nitrosomonas sp.]